MPGMARPRRTWWRRLLLAAGAFAAALVAAEAALRIAAFATADDQLARWRAETAGGAHLTKGQVVPLGRLVRPAADPDVVYELLPDLDVVFQRQPVRTGSLGFRGGDPPPRGAHDVVVVGIGDSVMFGSGVAHEDTFLAALGERLRRRFPDRTVVTVNTAVPGYDTAMEVATLRTKCLPLRPTIVVCDFVENDFDLPNFLLLPPDPLRTDRLFLYDLAYGVLRRDNLPNGPLERAPMATKLRFESSPDRVPERYRHMVGVDGYHRALAAFAALAKQHAFHAVVSCHTAIDPDAQRICDELGVPVVTAAARQRAWLAANGDPKLRDSALVLAPDDLHPSALGHRLLAEELDEFLVAHHWVPD